MVEFFGQMYMRLSDWNTLRLLKSQPKGVDGHGSASLILLLICVWLLLFIWVIIYSKVLLQCSLPLFLENQAFLNSLNPKINMHILHISSRRILSIKTYFHFSQPKILLRSVWLQGEIECWLVTFRRGLRGLEVNGELIWKDSATDTISIISNLKAAYPKLLRADYHGCILNSKFIFCFSLLIYHCWKIKYVWLRKSFFQKCCNDPNRIIIHFWETAHLPPPQSQH